MEREVAERGLITEIGWSAERLFRRSRSAHMLWCMAGADVGQFVRFRTLVILRRVRVRVRVKFRVS